MDICDVSTIAPTLSKTLFWGYPVGTAVRRSFLMSGWKGGRDRNRRDPSIQQDNQCRITFHSSLRSAEKWMSHHPDPHGFSQGRSVKGDVVRIRDVEAKRGTTHRGFVRVGETPVGPIQFPIVIIQGAKPGPTLCLTAGVHAAEYPGIAAVTQVTRSVRAEELTGTIIAVPVVNQPMFQARAGFLSPIDGLNLNRMFPGSPTGSISEILAHVLLNEVVVLADY